MPGPNRSLGAPRRSAHGVLSDSMRFTSGPVRLFDQARELRRHMTAAERRLWQAIRRKQTGAGFRTQEPVLGYIVDFYSSPLQIAIEVDGAVHDDRTQKIYDERRDQRMQAVNILVLRFTNEDVMNNLATVVSAIKTVVADRKINMPFKVQRKRVALDATKRS